MSDQVNLKMTSDIGPESFHKEIEKKMRQLADVNQLRPAEINYKDYEIRAYPNKGKISVQIDGYGLNQYFNSAQEAIKTAKDRIDKWSRG